MAASGVPAAEASLALQTIEPSSAADGERGSSSTARTAEKDPRKIARKYQLDLCKKALEENIIVCLGTGCGKTLISVLLMYELGHLIKKPLENICVFLAPTVALVQQQARVIEEFVDFKVGVCCGNSKHLKSHRDWEKEIEQYEVLVMTPQVLLRNLCHRFIKMELIALLIFDECHHAQLESDHPYAEIMKVFYKTDVKLPRIFGMTASPKLGKGASINGLETLLHAKVYTVEDKEELESFVVSPKVKVYQYGPLMNNGSCIHMPYEMKLEEIKRKCTSMLSMKTDDHGVLQSSKRMLLRLHCHVIFCLQSLGLWGALEACSILLNGDRFELNELTEAEGYCNEDSVCDEYLSHAASVFTSDYLRDGCDCNVSCAEVLKVPFVSKKLLCLIGILSNFRLQTDMKCIVFVNRIVIARSMSKILQNLKILEAWKCDFLVGVHSGLKSMSRKRMNVILKKFHSGELNLLVATKVGEEGLDIQTCCLVVRFDLPETVASFIQSRGRARMPQSEYAFLVDSSQRELNLIEAFKEAEDQMNKEIALRTSSETSVTFEERVYKVDSTGATISSGASVSLLYHYCSKLPRDEFFNPKPDFFYFDSTDGTVCRVILPANAPINQIVSSPQSSRESAKKDACLKACEELHKLGALTSYLLPDHDNAYEDGLMLESSDSDSCEDEESRGELHEMLVPAALREPWSKLENHVCLNSYFIKFNPVPEDRLYKKFGLFVKALLPREAAGMEVDLHLARGRSVMARLVPLGVAEFDRDEILQAQNFQEMFLKIILDRSEFIPSFLQLEKNDICKSGSLTFYLLLPVILDELKNTMTVDWKVVRRCLSSPIFRTPAYAGNEIGTSNNCLQLDNGPTRINDIEDSLVYVPYKKKFFFVSRVLHEKNGYSPYNDSTSHVEHLNEMFGIQLSYPEQRLLKVKQLFCLRNLLHDRKKGNSESRELEECFFELPPELCQLKIIGFSKDIGSSLSLLPSIMHRLEGLLVAVELKQRLSACFPEGANVTAHRILEALTTERCNERISLERLEVLGDAFLKFAVGRHMFLQHTAIDEGQLTKKRSKIVNNSNLFQLAIVHKIQVYIRDQSFDPCQLFALGRPCRIVCNKETETTTHGSNTAVFRCTKNHHWLRKKTIADVVEALVGAFIVDSGFKAATAFLRWMGIQVDFEASQVNNVCCASARFMPLLTFMDVTDLEKSSGHQFLHRGLLVEAFVHPSYNKNGGGCYQRLEFLGDAVLDYLITSYLYSVYPKLNPGQLTDLRSMYVNNNAFASVAVSRSFDQFIICDSGNLYEAIKKYVNFLKTPASAIVPPGPKCPKALGDLVESCIGAILLDTGFDLNSAWKIMTSFLDPITSSASLQINPIRELQELCQRHNWKLQFVPEKKGKIFSVQITVNGNDVCLSDCASNPNKKAAMRLAAEQMCVKLKAQGYEVRSKLLELEEVLKSNYKMEPRLIGYDETPIDVMPPSIIESVNSKVREPSISAAKCRLNFINEQPTKTCSSSIKPARNASSLFEVPALQPSKTDENNSCDLDAQNTGGSLRGTAKSCLYEFCKANSLKPPLFECCKEEGPSHLKLFTFKVVVEIEEASDLILECFGAPRMKKKAAAEHAAEGALWYLKGMGYLPISE
ncbi:dicer-like protein 4 isoform X2 [Malania oleifera]|uniref:dicer-like protein 4 isoform X2 n=1 Tax=Malania oleifera TaxID=397392 RepID=UPI0025AE1F0C|nr:dicer-like protein 4 isoform X2 [Malania oleifera]